MKNTIIVLLLILLIIATVFALRCCRTDVDLNFSGTVVDYGNKPLSGVKVSVGGQEQSTNEKGEFSIKVFPSIRYVLNATKFGFGLVSEVYGRPTTGIKFTMAKTTVVTADPSRDIVVQDTNPDMTVPLSSNLPTPKTPLDTLPFVYNDKGQLIDFKLPQSLINSYKSIKQYGRPKLGARLTIPAGSLVYQGSQSQVSNDVQVSLNTVDIYSENGMPGDMSASDSKEGATYMISFGAANVEAMQGERYLQLANKMHAILTIPVDTMAIIRKDTLPASIPFLTYNMTTGLWDRIGDAKLNAERTAYTAEVPHFSTFNTDQLKINPACHVLENKLTYPASPTPNPWTMEVTWSTGVSAAKEFKEGCTAGSGKKLTAIVNLPPNEPLGMRIFNGTDLIATYAAWGGPGGAYANQAELATRTASCDYGTCSGPTVIDSPWCWIKDPVAGTMKGPVLAMERNGAASDFRFTWIYIDAVSAGNVNNPALDYKIQWVKAATPTSDPDFETNPEFVQFSAGDDIWEAAAGSIFVSSTGLTFLHVQNSGGTALDTTSTYFFRVLFVPHGSASNTAYKIGRTSWVAPSTTVVSFDPCTEIGTDSSVTVP